MSSADCQKFLLFRNIFCSGPLSVSPFGKILSAGGPRRLRRLWKNTASFMRLRTKKNCELTQLLCKREFIERFFKSPTDIMAFAFLTSAFLTSAFFPSIFVDWNAFSLREVGAFLYEQICSPQEKTCGLHILVREYEKSFTYDPDRCGKRWNKLRLPCPLLSPYFVI